MHCGRWTKMLRKSTSFRGVNIIQNSLRFFSTSSPIDCIRPSRILLNPRHVVSRYQLIAHHRRFSAKQSDEVWTTAISFVYHSLYSLNEFYRLDRYGKQAIFCVCSFSTKTNNRDFTIFHSIHHYFFFRTKKIYSLKAAKNWHSTIYSETLRGKRIHI